MGKIAFQQEPEDKCFHLKGVVSRKKQMNPGYDGAAQIWANDILLIIKIFPAKRLLKATAHKVKSNAEGSLHGKFFT